MPIGWTIMPSVNSLRNFGVDFTNPLATFSPEGTLSNWLSNWSESSLKEKISNGDFVDVICTRDYEFDVRANHLNLYCGNYVPNFPGYWLSFPANLEFKETEENEKYVDVRAVDKDSNLLGYFRFYLCSECENLYLPCDYFHSHDYTNNTFICDNCYESYEESRMERERQEEIEEEEGGSSAYYIERYKSFGRFMPLEYGVSPFDVWGKKVLLSKNQKKRFSSDFNSSKKNPFTLYGIELECVARDRYDTNQTWRDVCEYLEDVGIVKCDGSLPDNGFEIVTLPGTLEFHQEFWPGFLKNFEGKLAGFRHKSCGIHIHMDKKSLSHLDQVKIVKFINASYNRKFVEGIAQRSGNNYCLYDTGARTIAHCFSAPSYVYKTMRDSLSNNLITCRTNSNFRSTEYNYFDKYRAVNISPRGKNTIEFRMFQSNVAPTGFLKNVEFIDALHLFVSTTSVKALTDASFRNEFYFRRNSNLYRSKYPNLDYFMQKELNKNTGFPVLEDVSKVKGKVQFVKEPQRMKLVTKQKLERASASELGLGSSLDDADNNANAA